MQIISTILETAFRTAFTELGLSTDVPVRLVESTNPDFGDFQVNGAMGAAKTLKTNPRELAGRVIEKVDLTGIVSKLEIAGPGFINITLDNDFLAKFVGGLTEANKYGVNFLGHKPEKVIVDLSSPNLAKEMHVGHLRSTVIGDALARVFEYMGDNVVRQNHVGDWGTQFGMLIALMLEVGFANNPDGTNKSIDSFAVNDLEEFYRNAKQRFDTDEEFANTARQYVVKLQSTNPGITLDYWKTFRDVSLSHCQSVYDILGVNLNKNDVMGESSYNEELPKVVERLTAQNLLVESKGAKCIFFTEGELPGGEETPFIVQKQDGGYLYSTTDLAAMDYRVFKLDADRIVYVVDARQAFHFKQLFIVGKKAGFAKTETKLEHSAFGTMMNEDGRPFKTRDGGTVKLIDLIDEAIVRASKIVAERNPEWSELEQSELARHLAIGAVKYSDLSKNRNSDYIFSFDKMLAFDGNTAPYLLYAYTRIQSILKKASAADLNGTINVAETAEHRLALHIARFAENLDIASRECLPHYICQYLYNLAGLFMQFYEACPILKADDVATIQSRLALAKLTAETLKTGLDLLGISVVDRM